MNALIGVIDFLRFDIPISQPRSGTFAPGVVALSAARRKCEMPGRPWTTKLRAIPAAKSSRYSILLRYLFRAPSRSPRAETLPTLTFSSKCGGIAPPLGGSDGIPPGPEAATGRFGGLRVLALRPNRYHGLVLVSDLCVLARPKKRRPQCAYRPACSHSRP